MSDRERATGQDAGAEQSYKETIRAVKQFMGWTEVPSFRTSEDQDDHPYLLSKPPTAGN